MNHATKLDLILHIVALVGLAIAFVAFLAVLVVLLHNEIKLYALRKFEKELNKMEEKE